MSEFEQWFKQERIDQGYVLSDGEPDNAEIGITRDWALLGWQAAKQSMQGEPVAWLLRLKLGEKIERFVRFHPNEGGQPLYTHAPDDAATIADLQAQVEELRKDAERYRWLREQNELLQDDAFLVLDRDVHCEHCESTWVGVDLDAAIDAAISKGGE